MSTTKCIWSILLAILTIIAFIYIYLKRHFNYWISRDVKGPRAYPFVGTNWPKLTRPLSYVQLDWAKLYGSVYGVFNGWKPMLIVADPELIKQVLVKDFHIFTDRGAERSEHAIIRQNVAQVKGDDWRRLRTTLTPAFASGKLRQMYASLGQCADQLVDHWEPYARHHKPVNILDSYQRLTMNGIAKCGFGTTINSFDDPDHPFVANGRRFFDYPPFAQLVALPALLLRALGIIPWRTAGTDNDSHNQFFFKLTKQIVDDRRQTPGASKLYNDFMQLLADSSENKNDPGQSQTNVNINREQNKRLINNRLPLTDEEIMAQGCLFMMAGFQSTSVTLAYCTYALALNPGIQSRLYDEVVAAAKGGVDSMGDIPYDVLTQLPYLDAVLAETLRLYPPILRLLRSCRQSGYTLGSSGIQLEAGQELEIPVYAVHHSSHNYANPEKFDPDRFMPQNKHQIHTYAYLPFGAGPRNCMAVNFALLEAKVCLARVIRRYRFVRLNETSVPLDYRRVTYFFTPKSVTIGIEMIQ